MRKNDDPANHSTAFAKLRERYATLWMADKYRFIDKQQSIRSGRLVQWSPEDIALANRGGHEWMAHLPQEHDFYGGVAFDPRAPQRTVDDRFNLFPHDWSISPTAGDATPINDFMRRVWCSGDDHILARATTQLAHIFQRPADRPGLPMVYCTSDDVGVMLPFFEGLRPMLGSMYGQTLLTDHLGRRGNDYAASKLLVFSHDLPVKTDVARELQAPSVVIIQKRGLRYELPHLARYVGMSRVPFAQARRNKHFAVLPVSRCDDRDLQELRDWLEHRGGQAIWLHYLLNFQPGDRGLSWDCVYEPIQLSVPSQIIENDVGDEFFVILIEQGFVPSQSEDSAAGAEWTWPLDCSTEIACNQLRTAYARYVNDYRLERHYPAKFKKWIGKKLSDCKVTIREQRRNIAGLELPPRSEVLARLQNGNAVEGRPDED